MWKLFWFKDKHSIVMNIMYLIGIVLFALTINSKYGTNFHFVFFYIVLFLELSNNNIFSISAHFGQSFDSAPFRSITSTLESNLKLLSIKLSTFVRYNVFYTVLRLIPFWFLIIIISPTPENMTFIIVFTFTLILMSYVRPIYSIFVSKKIEIYLDNKGINRKEMVDIQKEKFKQDYPLMNVKLFFYSKIIQLIGELFIIFFMFFYFFPYLDGQQVVIENLTVNTYKVIGLIGLIIFIGYGYYFNRIENVQDYEIHK